MARFANSDAIVYGGGELWLEDLSSAVLFVEVMLLLPTVSRCRDSR